MYSVVNSVTEKGIGLFSGKAISLTLSKTPHKGIWFKNKYGYLSKLMLENISVNNHNTSILFKDNTSIRLIEHLLSAIFSFGISDILITVDSDEIPLFDGSSISYIFLLKELKLIKNDYFKIGILTKKIEVRDGDFFIKASPSNKLIFDYTIDFKDTIIGRQHLKFNFSKKEFINDIGKARTFGVIDNLELAKKFYPGANIENTMIISKNKFLSKERIDKEFVKHKILDAIGDLYTIGYPTLLEYKSFGGSHKLNNLLLNKIVKENAINILDVKDISIEKERNFALSFI